MKTFKGFDKDLKCRDFQYEIGKTFEMDEDLIRCNSKGFHSCENALDVFSCYAPAENRFCECEVNGKVDKWIYNTKLASSKITIKTEINLFGIIKAGVEYILNKVNWEDKKESNTGDQSAATNTGHQSAATNTGDQSAATNTGDRSAATNTGGQSAATNTGDRSAATNTGYRSAATNTGHQSAATNTGDQSAATNTGDRSAATNTGDQSAATNTGDRSAATNTGYRSAATVEGNESIACGLGIENKAKGTLGCWIVLSEWFQDKNYNWHIKIIKTVKIDGDIIKPNTWYQLVNGEFTEVSN